MLHGHALHCHSNGIHGAADARDPFIALKLFEAECQASKSVAAVTSTVWATPSMSAIVTRQERTSIAREYHIRFLFAIWFWLAFFYQN